MSAAHASTAESSARAADARARELAATTFASPLILEAGAGTGKTAVLVARILVWSLGEGCERARTDPQQDLHLDAVAERVFRRVVAITFTEKAAAEISERVHAALHALSHGEAVIGLDRSWFRCTEDELKARASHFLRAIDQFRATTIHGFCAGVLRSSSLGAGLHPGFTIDEDESRLRRVIDSIVADHVASDGPVVESALVQLACRGVDPSLLRDRLLDFSRKRIRSEDVPDEPYAKPVFDANLARLQTEIDALLAIIAEPLAKGSRVAKALEAVDALRKLRAQLARINSVASLKKVIVETADSLLSDNSKLQDWSHETFSASEAKALGSDVVAVSERSSLLHLHLKILEATDPEILPLACRCLKPWLREVEERVRREGIVSFSALLHHTHNLLASAPEAAQRIRGSIDQLLVDEFQDTDPIQYEIVRHLALEGDRAARPGLFLVGDPKQSIYGWRGADLQAYDDFKVQVLEAGGSVHNLVVNHRSVRSILDEVSRVIDPVMQEVKGLQPAFEPLLEAQDDRAPAPEPASDQVQGPVEYWISWRLPLVATQGDTRKTGPATGNQDAMEIEAREIARDLRLGHDDPARGLRWKDSAILLRKTAPMETYLEALREQDIPYQVERDRGFYKRREIIDAVSLVRCIFDSNDVISLLGFLKSPIVGAPDAAWIPLFEAGLPALAARLGPEFRGTREIATVVERARKQVIVLEPEIPDLRLVSRWPKLLADALGGLVELRTSLVCDSADVFVARLRDRFGAELTEAARVRGEYRVANLDRFFQNLLEILIDPRGGSAALERALKEALGEERDEREGSPGDAEVDAVRVMTIHKAKGLTFRQVFIPALHGGARTSTLLGSESPNVFRGRLEFSIAGACTLNWDLILCEARKREAAERVRLLYVAMTRPKSRLILAGNWRDPGADRKPIGRASRFVELLEHRRGARGNVLALASNSKQEGAAIRGEDGVVYRIPASTESTGRRPQARHKDSFQIGAVVEFEQRLDVLRPKALEHQEARLTAPVTLPDMNQDEQAMSLREKFAATGVLDDGSEESAGRSLPEETPDTSRDFRRVVGTMIHRAFETFALDLPFDAALDLARQSFLASFSNVKTRFGAGAEVEAASLFDQVVSNGWFEKLHTQKDALIARELPMLLSTSEKEPALVGSIDLLCRDPATREFVIVDYKLALEPDGTGDGASERYDVQRRTYGEAVQRALGLPKPPRFEFWWLMSPSPRSGG